MRAFQLKPSGNRSREIAIGLAIVAFLSVVLHGYSAYPAMRPDAEKLTGQREVQVKLTRARSGKQVLFLSGSSLADPGDEYGVKATIVRIPCSGRFRYVASGEDRRSDADTEFDAILWLQRQRTAPRGLPCGHPLPGRTGQRASRVVLSDEGVIPFSLKLRARKLAAPFHGILTLNGLPVCNQAYRLEARLENPASRREYLYRATVVAAVAVLNHHAQKVPSCEPPPER